jgi:hypothetical protein
MYGLFRLASAALVADEPPGADHDRMAAIAAALCAQRSKYRDIEYVARTVIRDPCRKDQADPAELATLATRRIVFQRDRSYLRYDAFKSVPFHEGAKAWGHLFGRFTVTAVPHPVAVDHRGTIVACDQLQESIATVGSLVKMRESTAPRFPSPGNGRIATTRFAICGVSL